MLRSAALGPFEGTRFSGSDPVLGLLDGAQRDWRAKRQTKVE